MPPYLGEWGVWTGGALLLFVASLYVVLALQFVAIGERHASAWLRKRIEARERARG